MNWQWIVMRIHRSPIAGTTVVLLNPKVHAADDPFPRVTRPLLARKCFACQGPNSSRRLANLRLDQRSTALEAGTLVPG